MVETKNIDLRKISDKGFIGFSVKAEDSEANSKIHKDFFTLCQNESSNNYTAGLGLLLKVYEMMNVFRVLYSDLEDVKVELADLASEVYSLKESFEGLEKGVKPSSNEKVEKGGVF